MDTILLCLLTLFLVAAVVALIIRVLWDRHFTKSLAFGGSPNPIVDGAIIDQGGRTDEEQGQQQVQPFEVSLGNINAALRSSLKQRIPLIERSIENQVKTIPVVARAQPYQLDIAYDENAKARKIGSVRFKILVEGTGVLVANNGEAQLESGGEANRATDSLQITPTHIGDASLQLDVFQGSRWAQQLIFHMAVQSLQEVTALLDQAPEATQEQITKSEPLPHQYPPEYLPDVQLNVWYQPGWKEDLTYHVRVTEAGGNWRDVGTPLTETDLADHVEALTNIFDDLRKVEIGDQIGLSQEHVNDLDYRKWLKELAQQGYLTFKRIFADPQDQEYLLAILSKHPNAKIEITSGRFFLPWELLYTPYDPDHIDVKNFWGFRHIIVRTLPKTSTGSVSGIIRTPWPRVILLNGSSWSDFASEDLFIHQLARDGKINLMDRDSLDKFGQDESRYTWVYGNADPLFSIRAMPEHQEHGFVERLQAYLSLNVSDITHFGCHAHTDLKIRDNSYLQLSEDALIRRIDFKVNNFRLSGNPIVFLNACRTGIRDPRRTSDFVHTFLDLGARGVLATEINVPNEFGAEFIKNFYDRILPKPEDFSDLLETYVNYDIQRKQEPISDPNLSSLYFNDPLRLEQESSSDPNLSSRYFKHTPLREQETSDDHTMKLENFNKALLETRLHFLDEYRNPLGLLYASYMPLETCFQIVPPEENDDSSQYGRFGMIL